MSPNGESSKIKTEYLWIVTLIFSVLSVFNWQSANQTLKELKSKLNVTGSCNENILIFNRVPKVGSQTVNHLIGALREINNFTGI